MKRVASCLTLGLVLLLIVGIGKVNAQFTLAEDNASNYSGWADGDDKGYGFGNWVFRTSGNAGGFIGDPASAGISGMSGTSFGLYANPKTGSNVVNVDRTFSPMHEGDTLSFQWGVNFDAGGDGGKGIDIYSGGLSGTKLLNINIGGDQNISITGDSTTTLFSNYGSNAMTIHIEYVADTKLRVYATGRDGSESYDDTVSVSSGTPDFISFYAFNLDNLSFTDQRQPYFNNLKITSANAYRDLTTTEGYRLLTAPASVTFSSFLNPIWTQGVTIGGDTDTGSPNVFTWNNASTNGDNTNWVGLTDLSGDLSAGTGFLVYVYADDNYDGSDDGFPKTLSVSGSENPVNVSPSLNNNNDGWTLVGNPFSTTIDFDNVTTNDLTDVAYVWDSNDGTGDGGTDANASGSWKTWNGTTGDLTDGLIMAFQGFFVQNVSSVTSPSLTFGSESKSYGGIFHGKSVKELAKVRLLLEGNGLKNSTWFQFTDYGSFSDKVMGDAVELDPLSDSFARLSLAKGDALFDISNLPFTENEYSLPLDVTATESGLFTLSVTDFSQPEGMDIIFKDYQTDREIQVNDDFIYEFELNTVKTKNINPDKIFLQGAMAAKVAETPRFGIVVRPKTTSSTEPDEIPVSFALDQNYPNPFNPTTMINYELPSNGLVKLQVFDLMGRKVTELVDGMMSEGKHSVAWNAQNASSGMYYYRLEINGQSLVRKMTLIK